MKQLVSPRHTELKHMALPASTRRFGDVANLSPTASSGAKSRSWLSPRGLHFIHSYLEWKQCQFHGTNPPRCDAANVDPPMLRAIGTSPTDSQPPPPLAELDSDLNSDSNSDTFALCVFRRTTTTYRCPVYPNRMHRMSNLNEIKSLGWTGLRP
jgi:hypothetical protein